MRLDDDLFCSCGKQAGLARLLQVCKSAVYASIFAALICFPCIDVFPSDLSLYVSKAQDMRLIKDSTQYAEIYQLQYRGVVDTVYFRHAFCFPVRLLSCTGAGCQTLCDFHCLVFIPLRQLLPDPLPMKAFQLIVSFL